jgi:hypothetical protein
MWDNKKLRRKVERREEGEEATREIRKKMTTVDQLFIHQKLLTTVQNCA